MFNLGHGVLPETNPDAMSRIVELVHAWRPRPRRGGRMTGADSAGERVGVLVMAYGTPTGPDDVEAYYTHIRRGRPPTAGAAR